LSYRRVKRVLILRTEVLNCKEDLGAARDAPRPNAER